MRVLASDQRYAAIVTPGGPGPNPPKWPVMASGSDVMPGRWLAGSAQRSGVRAGCGRSWEDLAQATAYMNL
jgi:hypothetical protein